MINVLIRRIGVRFEDDQVFGFEWLLGQEQKPIEMATKWLRQDLMTNEQYRRIVYEIVSFQFAMAAKREQENADHSGWQDTEFA